MTVAELIKELQGMPQDAQQELQQLLSLHGKVKGFIDCHDIHSSEVIAQCDDVITSGYEFIEDLCNIVGYKE